MELPAVIVLVALAFVLGGAFVAACLWPEQAALEVPVEEVPPPVVVEPAEEAPLPPAPPSTMLPVRARFLPLGQHLVEVLEVPEGKRPAAARALAMMAADHWALGLNEMRLALVQRSGLNPVLIELISQRAITALEARHAVGAAAQRR